MQNYSVFHVGRQLNIQKQIETWQVRPPALPPPLEDTLTHHSPLLKAPSQKAAAGLGDWEVKGLIHRCIPISTTMTSRTGLFRATSQVRDASLDTRVVVGICNASAAAGYMRTTSTDRATVCFDLFPICSWLRHQKNYSTCPLIVSLWTADVFPVVAFSLRKITFFSAGETKAETTGCSRRRAYSLLIPPATKNSSWLLSCPICLLV